MVSYPKEERLLTIRDGILYVFKRIVVQTAAKRSLKSLFGSKQAETPVDLMA